MSLNTIESHPVMRDSGVDQGPTPPLTAMPSTREHPRPSMGLGADAFSVLGALGALGSLSGCGSETADAFAQILPPPHTAINRLDLLTSNAPLGAGNNESSPHVSLRAAVTPAVTSVATTAVTTTSATTSTSTTTSTDANSLFNWAEQQYPALFPGVKTNLTTTSYLYRYYPETKNYIGVGVSGSSIGNVYVLGPLSGGVLAMVGTLQGFACQVSGGACTLTSANDAARFLSQATLGYTRADLNNLSQTTISQWLDAQCALPTSMSYFSWLFNNGYDSSGFENSTAGLDNMVWKKLISSPDVLRQKMVQAFSEIWVVSVVGINASWRQFSIANYLDVLEANVFGNFRTLLEQITMTPAMAYYLTYQGNVKTNTVTGSQPDENYARELMQLFTIGLLNLNNDGSLQLVNGAPVQTYSQSDVSGLARVFTGWSVDTHGLTSPYGPIYQQRPLVQVSTKYETGAKTFLGVTIPAGSTAAQSLKIALDTVFNHANTAPFVSRQLIQKLVTSNPSAGYINRVANVFINNGSSVRGDLKAVIKAVLMDPEARDLSLAQQNNSFGKVREPILRFLSWARAFNANSPADSWTIGDLSNPGTALGQSPMRSPTVFNFYRPGYVPPNSALSSAGLVAPELQLSDETTVAAYVNYMQKAIAGTGVGDLRADYTLLQALASNSSALLAEINTLLACGEVDAQTLNNFKVALDTISVTTAAGVMNRIYAALTLVLACPQFIVQK